MTSKILLIISLFTFQLQKSLAQEKEITKAYKNEVILKLSQLIKDFYVFENLGVKTSNHLENQFKKGNFKSVKTNKDFAKLLTKTVQDINKDKHMRIWVNKPFEPLLNTSENWIENVLDGNDWLKNNNAGFHEVKRLDDNIGYIDLREFAPLAVGKSFADAYMKLISQCDAIIIDLSKNGGGDPFMVQYLSSYFFNEKTLLNSLYWREGNKTEEFWVLDSIEGEKRPKIPLFIMTSSKTFSAAEEFSYNMQIQKRATLVGQITGGGANPGRGMNINTELGVFIPLGKAINPITNTNWDGKGVIPDIKTSENETFNKTYALAKTAAKKHKTQIQSENRLLLTTLIQILDKPLHSESDRNIEVQLKKCVESKVLNEIEINRLGYQYLMEYSKPKQAEFILKTNTVLYPESPNAFDSYAESLMANGDLESALKISRKSLELAEELKDTVLIEVCNRTLNNIKLQLK